MIELGFNLSFNGNCKEAFRFYEKCFGGKIQVMMTWGESPMAKDVGPEWADKITHASMTIGNRELTGGDSPGANFQQPQGFSVILNLKDRDKADKYFEALSENGTVKVPMAETFWAARFGMVTDRFGIPWMINCTKAG